MYQVHNSIQKNKILQNKSAKLLHCHKDFQSTTTKNTKKTTKSNIASIFPSSSPLFCQHINGRELNHLPRQSSLYQAQSVNLEED